MAGYFQASSISWSLRRLLASTAIFGICGTFASNANAEELKEALSQPANVWVKRSPLKNTLISPRLGYEGSIGYDPIAKRIISYAGHNQGGGGEQNAELWLYDPLTTRWELRQPGIRPPGACCNMQNVFNPVENQFLRFRAASGSHGWHWFRHTYLQNTGVWKYDLSKNRWRNMRSAPDFRVRYMRCASWDSEHQVVVVFGGEGSRDGTLVYDPYVNTWTQMKPDRQPAFRSGGQMAYDAARKRHILFGSQFQDDPHTWAYDLRTNSWHDMQPKVQPPTNRNSAVLAYDEANRVVIAIVVAVDEFKEDGSPKQSHLETWAYDAGKNHWKKMNPPKEPDQGPGRGRKLVYLPDHKLFLLENYCRPNQSRTGEREQQIWTYRYAAVPTDDLPLPPTDLKVTTKSDSAQLSWKPSPTQQVAKYVVYRGQGEVPWEVDFQRIATLDGRSTSYLDASLDSGALYHYYLCTIDASGMTSRASVKARTQSRFLTDIVVSVVSPKQVQLKWSAPKSKDLAGYHVERAAVQVYSEAQIYRLKESTPPLAEPSVGGIKQIGAFERITTEPLTSAEFQDTQVDLASPGSLAKPLSQEDWFVERQIDSEGKPYSRAVYAYRVRAVNQLGVSSGPSPYVLTIPSAPRSLFSQEDGEQCRLRWAPNPEQGIQGYRVYRMSGPRINGPGQKVVRVTQNPVAESSYVDSEAGEITKRYWVVAVDALGQEGLPSSPTWHNRQWKQFYVPFVGPWHQ